MMESTSPGGGFGGPDDALFVPGVDYVSPWREADGVAYALNQAAAAAGVDARLVRAVPHVGAHGEPVVWLRLEDARVITQALCAPDGPQVGPVAAERAAVEREREEERDGTG